MPFARVRSARTAVALDSRIRIVVAGNFLAIAARMSLVTYLSIYFVREVGVEVMLVGVAFLVENLSRGLLAPFFGALSDRTGRRGPVLVGVLGSAIVLPCFLLVQGPASLLAWSLGMGLAAAVQFPARNALLVDLAPPARRQTVLAINYTAISAGYTLGVAPGGFLAEQGYGVLAIGASAGYLAVAALFALGLRGPLPQERALAEISVLRHTLAAARDGVFVRFALLAFIFPFAMGLFAFVSALFGADLGVGESVIGLILGANGVLVAVFAVPVAKRIEPQGPFHLLGPAAALAAVSFACFALVPGPVAALLVGVMVMTVGELVFSSAVPAAVARLAPAGAHGAYQGAWSLVQSLGMGSAFIASGFLREFVGWRTTWLVFAGVALAAALALLAAREHFRRASERPERR